MIISSFINKIRTRVDKTSIPQTRVYGFKMKPVLSEDTFERKTSSTSLPKLEITESTCTFYDSAYKELDKLCEIQHKKRSEKYDRGEELPEAENASNNKYKAVNWIQNELGTYSDVIKKLKNNEPLNAKEQNEFNFILSQMQPCTEDRTLWRIVAPYKGFKEQINSGMLDLNLLNSTNSKYDGFMGWWNHPEMVEKAGDKYKFAVPLVLKINVKKGTKLLDCNIKHGKDFVKMRSEVVLPPSKARVDNIDNDLGVIELTVTDSMQ